MTTGSLSTTHLPPADTPLEPSLCVCAGARRSPSPALWTSTHPSQNRSGPSPSLSNLACLSSLLSLYSQTQTPRSCPHDLSPPCSFPSPTSSPRPSTQLSALHALIIAFLYQFPLSFPETQSLAWPSRRDSLPLARLSRIGASPEITTELLPRKRVAVSSTISIAPPALRLDLRELACDGRTPLCFGLA